MSRGCSPNILASCVSSWSSASRAIGFDSSTFGTIAGTEDVLEAEYDHGARRRAVYQAQLRLQHQHTGGLTANKCPRHIKAMFRQQLIKRVARDATRDVRITTVDQVRVTVAQPTKALITFGSATTRISAVVVAILLNPFVRMN